MLLIGVKENNNWLSSRWNLTYQVSWNQIVKACAFSSEYYNGFQVLVDGEVVSAKSKDDIMNLNNGNKLTFRGVSKIINGEPIMITCYDQSNIVDVSVGMDGDEFSEADYEKFNKSMGQYLDSIELAMYR